MRIQLTLAALLLVAPAGRAQDPPPDAPPAPAEAPKGPPPLDARYLEKLVAIRDKVHAGYATLAEWCEREGLWLQARYLAQDILEVTPRHPIGGLDDKLKNQPVDDFKTAMSRAGKKGREEYATRKQVIDVPAAKELADLAKWCKGEKLAREEEDAYVQAYRHDGGNGTVNKFLHKAGYDVVFNYGLISKAEKDKASDVLKRIGGTFLTGQDKDFGRMLKEWPDAWGFQTKHYLLMSNAKHALVFRFAEECENLYEGLRLFCGTALPLRENYKSERLVVWLFGDETSYEVVLQTIGIQKNPAGGAAGFFGAYQRAYFFWADRLYKTKVQWVDPVRALIETFYHEGTHQAMALQLDLPNKGNMAKYRSAWIGEGIANYLETMEVTADAKGKRKFTFGFPHAYEGWRAANGHLMGAYWAANKTPGQDPFIPLKTFTTNDYQAYLSRGADAYCQALGLAHYLVHGEGGKYKPVFYEYVKQHYTLGGSNQLLWEMCGVTEAELEAGYTEWCKKLKLEVPPQPGGGQPAPGGEPAPAGG